MTNLGRNPCTDHRLELHDCLNLFASRLGLSVDKGASFAATVINLDVEEVQLVGTLHCADRGHGILLLDVRHLATGSIEDHFSVALGVHSRP